MELIVLLHQDINLVVEFLVISHLLLLGILELFLESGLTCFFFLQELRHLLLKTLPRFLKTLSLCQQLVIHVLKLLKLPVKLLVGPHLFNLSFLLTRSLVILQESHILLFDFLIFGILGLQLLAFRPQLHDLLLLLLQLFLLFLQQLDIFGLILIHFIQLLLLFLEKFLMLIVFSLQALNLLSLFVKLRLNRIILGFGYTHRFLDEFQTLYKLIILFIHRFDPILQLNLLLINQLLVLNQLFLLRFQLLNLVLHVAELILQGLVLGLVAVLELVDDVLVALDRAGHFLLEVVVLPLEFLGFALLQADLQDLLVEVMFHEFHFKEDIARLVDAIGTRVV